VLENEGDVAGKRNGCVEYFIAPAKKLWASSLCQPIAIGSLVLNTYGGLLFLFI